MAQTNYQKEPTVKNAADDKQVRGAVRDEKNRREQELNDVRNVLNSAFGRRFVWRLLEFSGIYKTSFTGNSHTFFNEGMRNIGLSIMTDINEACPEQLITMMKEAKENQHG